MLYMLLHLHESVLYFSFYKCGIILYLLACVGTLEYNERRSNAVGQSDRILSIPAQFSADSLTDGDL